MKRLITIIIAMTLAIAANAQSHSSHTFHWGDGTYTRVTTIGSNTYVTEGPCVVPNKYYFIASDSTGNSYKIGLKDDRYYEFADIAAPKVGSGYTVYTMEYIPNNNETIWHESGRLVIDEMPEAGRPGKMRFVQTGQLDTHNTFIVYDEYLDYFVDKNVNNMSGRKIKRKYGDVSWKVEAYCSDILVMTKTMY